MKLLNADLLRHEYFELAEEREGAMSETLAANRLRMRAIWQADFGLERAGGRRFWGRLIGYRAEISERFRKSGLPERLPHDDHCMLWNRNGLPFAWTSHAYDAVEADMVRSFAEKVGLRAYLPDYPSWHDQMTTLLIWTRADN